MKTIVVDQTISMKAQQERGHNRWHEAIPPVLTVESGESVVFETKDGYDTLLGPSSTAEDVLTLSQDVVHTLTGPVAIRDAHPGDVLAVTVEDVEPDPWRHWGYTMQTPGFGFLREYFNEPFLVHWDLDGKNGATSEQLPGVRIPFGGFPGVVGVAPSREYRESVVAREAALAARGGIVAPPDPADAIPGSGAIANEGLRTIPPRENGGNMDVKLLTEGSTVFLPVFTDGGLVSIGDVHYAQGDGESCDTAIEMAARVRVRIDVVSPSDAGPKVAQPHFSGVDSRYGAPAKAGSGRYYATSGTCVTPAGENRMDDLTLAARNALVEMIEYLKWRGYNAHQAYALCGVAVDLRICQTVNLPNLTVVAQIPLDIFDAK